MDDEFEYKFELLKQEMACLQDSIRTYDSNLLTIKGWAITIFSAFVFFSAQAKRPAYLVFCAASVMLFWLVDALFKELQMVFIHRYNRIEHFIQSQEFAEAVVGRSFKKFPVPDTSSGFRLIFKERVPNYLWAIIGLPTSVLYVVMLAMTVGLARVISMGGP